MASPRNYIWATGPLQLIPTPTYHHQRDGLPPESAQLARMTRAATMMAQVHNCFIRALNGIYHLAPKVPSHELADFVAYIQAMTQMIDFHHEEEEVYIFPEVEKVTGAKGIMEANVKGHEAFHGGLVELAKYARELLASDPQRFKTKRFMELWDSFAVPLQEHLAAEIQTLLDLRAYAHTELDLMKAAEAAAQKSMTMGVMVGQLPGLLLNHDRTFEEGFEPGLWPRDIPWVASVLVRRICTCWYWGRWKFTACDGAQMPRELPFMNSPDREEED